MVAPHPLVSIRIPVYNHAAFVADCLDSVLAESYPNKELVIMDDGSTDASPQIVREWAAKNRSRIDTVFYPRPHRGLTRTLNELITLCKGDYLVSLASDDMLIDGGIGARIAYLARHPDKMAVIGDCTVIGPEGEKLFDSGIFGLNGARKQDYLDPEKFRRQIIAQWAVPGPVLMVKKEIYARVGSYDVTSPVEDWDFYLRMVAGDLLGFVDHKVSAYRLHDASTCRGGHSRETAVLVALVKTAYRSLHLFSGVHKLLLFGRLVRNTMALVKRIRPGG